MLVAGATQCSTRGAHCGQGHYGHICLQGKLRIGLAEQTVLVALGHAVLLHRDQAPGEADQLAGALEEAAQTVKYVYSQCPSYDQMVPALLEHPIVVRGN